ncbi:hypothetical protein [Streptobacillus moniliformis]|uniref:hypothetical protein n=1 Tax=Streptobacillus moniliformis TaxID=34105 RepID=UPI0007E4012B|nr:hypothetical protein [Streptobacillus moniliformis]
MSVNNPQYNYINISKNWVISQDFFGFISVGLAILQEITRFFTPMSFLTIASVILVLEYISSYFAKVYFDKGHVIREKGLLDNSFQEKRIPNYNSVEYYNNEMIDGGYIKLLANIHENALFTSSISNIMSKWYFIVSIITFLIFLIKLFLSGMDEYSSILLGFIVSGSFFQRAMNIYSLKKVTEDIYDKANDICNLCEKNQNDSSVFLSNILELLLMYENAIFESKVILNQNVFDKLNYSLSKEWEKTRNTYSIYNREK